MIEGNVKWVGMESVREHTDLKPVSHVSLGREGSQQESYKPVCVGSLVVQKNVDKCCAIISLRVGENMFPSM